MVQKGREEGVGHLRRENGTGVQSVQA
jgi:hypothetical protein